MDLCTAIKERRKTHPDAGIAYHTVIESGDDSFEFTVSLKSKVAFKPEKVVLGL